MIESYKRMMEHDCLNLAFSTLMWGIVSQLLMVANSSMNFFIYCASSTVFREVLHDNLKAYGEACHAQCPIRFGRSAAGRRRMNNGSVELATSTTTVVPRRTSAAVAANSK